jgi:hypothetical protein
VESEAGGVVAAGGGVVSTGGGWPGGVGTAPSVCAIAAREIRSPKKPTVVANVRMRRQDTKSGRACK